MRLKALFSVAACLSGITALPAHSQTSNMSEQASFVSNYMQSQGSSTFVILDKNNAELLVVDQGQVVMRTPALYGKGSGEDERVDQNATPAGIFSIVEQRENPRLYQGGLVFNFLGTSHGNYVIHPTYQLNAAQRRNERLATATAEDNAISNGCVNVGYQFYVRMSDFLKTRITYTPTQDGRAVMASYPRFVVLPHTQDLNETLRLLTYRIPDTPSIALTNSHTRQP